MAQQPLVGQCLLIIETSRWHPQHTALVRIPLDEWSARRNDLYLTTHNTQKRQISIPAAGFKPAIPASERPQTHALDRAATGIGRPTIYINKTTLQWEYYKCFKGKTKHINKTVLLKTRQTWKFYMFNRCIFNKIILIKIIRHWFF